MAGFLCPGPVDVWAGLSSGAPSFIGHSRQGMNLDIQPAYQPFQCDLYGEDAADDYYGGQSAIVSGDMIRVNYGFFLAMMSYGNPSLAAGAGLAFPAGRFGADLPGDVGTMMVTEGVAYQLWLRFPYSPKPAFNIPGNILVPGYHFLAVHLMRNPMSGMGPRPKVITSTWQARRKPVAVSSNPYGSVALQLGDFDMSAIAGGVAV